jgi:hypothetical protein
MSVGEQETEKTGTHPLNVHPPLPELDGDGLSGGLADEVGEVGSNVDTLPLGLVEGTLADHLGDGVGDKGDGDLEELVGLLSSLLLGDADELSEGGLLVDEGLGQVIDGGDGSTLDGRLDGGLGLLSEGSDLGEGGGLDDTVDSGEDGGGVEGSEVGRSDELEQVRDEDDLGEGRASESSWER